jgi:hypothetical protein
VGHLSHVNKPKQPRYHDACRDDDARYCKDGFNPESKQQVKGFGTASSHPRVHVCLPEYEKQVANEAWYCKAKHKSESLSIPQQVTSNPLMNAAGEQEQLSAEVCLHNLPQCSLADSTPIMSASISHSKASVLSVYGSENPCR